MLSKDKLICFSEVPTCIYKSVSSLESFCYCFPQIEAVSPSALNISRQMALARKSISLIIRHRSYKRICLEGRVGDGCLCLIEVELYVYFN
jgi:hypothetical protein